MKKKLDLVMLQIDLGRQKETVQYLKDYIDFAKANGYNSVLLYLEAAVKVECTPFFYDDETYTPDEIREIVAYGNEKGIDIIPGLENLAHGENFLQYKELQFMSETLDAGEGARGVRGGGVGDCICMSNPKAMEFMDTYFTQVISLFTSPYVHAGMDEPFDFATCPRCVARLKNGETKKDLFYTHLMHTYNLLKGLGKRMMMWDDFFQYMDVVPQLPKDIIMCTWNYGYITDEMQGFWLNRKKKDWFRYYDQLGIEYLFCSFAQPTSKLYNTDTFTEYAMKYHPKGVLMTVWERSNRMNLSGYPGIAYSGRLWSGKATSDDKLKVYTEFLGSEEAADIVLNLEGSSASYQANSLKICENTTLSRYLHATVKDYAARKLKAILDGMEEGLQKDILTDIYVITLDGYLGLSRHLLTEEVFNNYESRNHKPAYFTKQVERWKELTQEAYDLYQPLWEKYRPGIKSMKGAFDRKFTGRLKGYDTFIADLQKNEKHGVFYADLMLHCVWGTPRIKLEIVYKDKDIAPTVYTPSPKVGTAVNTIRMAIENKPVDYVILTLTGEGAVYPCHFRYTCMGRKYEVSSVSKLSGQTRDLKNILCNDTQFAQMGNNDGQAHFEDVNLSKIEHKIKMKFKRMK